MTTETLTCMYGHEWKRTRTRGRKPVCCPQHRAENKTGGIPQEVIPVASGALSEPHSRVSDAMLEVLTGDKRLPREWVRKADYVVGQLDDPRILARRDDKDLNLLYEVQRDLVRQAARFA